VGDHVHVADSRLITSSLPAGLIRIRNVGVDVDVDVVVVAHSRRGRRE
jgi:hypothetical protein